ncbi:uncharacterized protein LOC108907569 [Anoplophora glabripennis]|uniref:uncharacterized protein LOC108907569 n=1 Tax=Anoplophora glabripennis TaxID=217634 RepID=UPI0008757CCA|nr:uncharacterized protein LOC108907569 [Anoplophora glabripennis]
MDQTKAVLKNDLISWVAKAVERKNFNTFKVTLDGTSEKCDGYIGDIVFVNVTGTNTDNKEETLHLVVKHSKQNDYFRASAFKHMFDAEIHFYDKVYPVLERFQLEKKLSVTFSAVPKCLKTLCLEKKEVLILESLKPQGYKLCDRRKPLNIFHIKAILEQFGRLHALSFALRDQRRNEFEAIVKNYPDFLGNFLRDKLTRGCFRPVLNNALKTLLDHGEAELVNKFEKIIAKYTDNVADVMAKIVDEDEEQSVIVHSDGWCNNYMFKYKGNNRTSPSEVVILDWQLSHLRSPALDLCYVFYATASSKELKHFDQLMKTYYASFSSFLTALGSDPEKLFPFSSLKVHWRKYSTFGVIFMALILSFVLCDKENAPDFGDLLSENGLEDMLVIDVSKNELFFERYRDIVRHYLECRF